MIIRLKESTKKKKKKMRLCMGGRAKLKGNGSLCWNLLKWNPFRFPLKPLLFGLFCCSFETSLGQIMYAEDQNCTPYPQNINIFSI